ncbi:MAG: DUF1844 domain-containing protein [Pirellulales bacterium]
MPDTPQEKPKIIVDEDWKSQAQAEKEALAAGKNASAADEDVAGGLPPMPPASLMTLISTLASQAMMSLGAIPHPFSGKPEVDLEQAKHFIDTLAVLEEKTAGNRTPEEEATLGQIVHELRMAYVAMQSVPPSTSGGGIEIPGGGPTSN